MHFDNKDVLRELYFSNQSFVLLANLFLQSISNFAMDWYMAWCL